MEPRGGVDGGSDDRIVVLCYSLAARISALRGGEDARAASAWPACAGAVLPISWIVTALP